MFKKKDPWPPPPPFVKILISIIEKKINENYVEFYFSMGTVLVIFSFFSMDNTPCSILAHPLGPPPNL